ncbi:hypothetical protein KP748_00640 [Streptococcus equi subsp. zooepidemicus]|nr:hypothetical protein [Streptococcus equi subsp. zooepidemicus]
MWSKTKSPVEKRTDAQSGAVLWVRIRKKKMGKEQRSDWLAYLKQVLGRSLISARYSIEGLC